MKKDERKPVVVKIQTGNAEALKGVHLYVFNQQGKLIESSSIEQGEVALKLSAETLETKLQFMIAPSLPKEYEGTKLNPLLMKKMGAYQPSIRLSKENTIHINGLPKLIFPFWNWCLITGRITKMFNIDGQNKILPVCDARVHICEIDRIRWWWHQIPVHIIDGFADHLKQVIRNPDLVLPPVNPELVFKPSGGLQVSVPFLKPERPGVIGGPDPVPFKRRDSLLNNVKLSLRAQSKSNTELKIASSSSLPLDIQSALLSSSTTLVHETIKSNFHLLHPYLCLWPWFWPYFYKSTPIATVYSDCDGRFNFDYFNFNNDKDIYVWVELCINGQWVTVYRPSIPCHTKWNYVCGSDINISITDPRVMPCSCDQHAHGEIVWFSSIGESATALHIQQNDASVEAVQGANIANVGCTDIIDANNYQISPFGKTLNFKLLFGDGLPTSGITHYRWRKTNLKDAALMDTTFPGTTVVNGMVQKTYFVITENPAGHFHFETKAVTLGAEGSGENIGYRIPHWDIYQDPGVPAADKALTIQWTSPDFYSASIDSSSLADGVWRFDLELLQLDTAGNFNVVEVPKQVFQVSDYNNAGNSVDAPDNYLRLVANPANARRLQVKVRIDNSQCHADIQDANITVNGNVEYSGICGFLHYTQINQPVHISFIAAHLRNFATFNFSVVKGNGTQNPGADQQGYVVSSVGLYNLNGGVFAHDFTVDQLKGTCPQAAFAEHLYVTCLATDGTRRLSEYDDSDLNAFALSNV